MKNTQGKGKKWTGIATISMLMLTGLLVLFGSASAHGSDDSGVSTLSEAKQLLLDLADRLTNAANSIDTSSSADDGSMGDGDSGTGDSGTGDNGTGSAGIGGTGADDGSGDGSGATFTVDSAQIVSADAVCAKQGGFPPAAATIIVKVTGQGLDNLPDGTFGFKTAGAASAHYLCDADLVVLWAFGEPPDDEQLEFTNEDTGETSKWDLAGTS